MRSRGACWDIHAVSRAVDMNHKPRQRARSAATPRSNRASDRSGSRITQRTAAYFARQVLPAAESAGSKRFSYNIYSVSLPGRSRPLMVASLTSDS